MNDAHGPFADLYSALAAERMRTLLGEACDDRLARLVRGARPTGTTGRVAGLVHAVRRAADAAVRWLRKGQLGGYPETCVTC